jgi:hypothetical protein
VIRAGAIRAGPSRSCASSGASGECHARIDSFEGKLTVRTPYQQGRPWAACRHQHCDDPRLHPAVLDSKLDDLSQAILVPS